MVTCDLRGEAKNNNRIIEKLTIDNGQLTIDSFLIDVKCCFIFFIFLIDLYKFKNRISSIFKASYTCVYKMFFVNYARVAFILYVYVCVCVCVCVCVTNYLE